MLGSALIVQFAVGILSAQEEPSSITAAHCHALLPQQHSDSMHCGSCGTTTRSRDRVSSPETRPTRDRQYILTSLLVVWAESRQRSPATCRAKSRISSLPRC